ncbi:hypothetical protein HDV57DRAFT_450494 [Trichoderma longibrachiatum]|uniref:Secreted protein n=1 Tax=Trichoderma longibrachiatum ATCC 18648 TaxID=983965 RepID=A0A2T4CGJ0_TRILO|nr:hypothetical protein M440DRAFT_201078 [Trichoderma longibrachiatum ATCC 18648]
MSPTPKSNRADCFLLCCLFFSCVVDNGSHFSSFSSSFYKADLSISFDLCIYHSHTQRHGLALACCTMDCRGRCSNIGPWRTGRV